MKSRDSVRVAPSSLFKKQRKVRVLFISLVDGQKMVA